MDCEKEKTTPKSLKCFPLSFEIEDDFIFTLFVIVQKFHKGYILLL